MILKQYMEQTDSFDVKMNELEKQLDDKGSEMLSAVRKFQQDIQELHALIDQKERYIQDLEGQIEKLNTLSNNSAAQDSEIAELKAQILQKESEILSTVSKLNADNQELQALLDQNQNSSENITNALQEKLSHIVELEEKLKTKEKQLLISEAAIDQLNQSQIKLEAVVLSQKSDSKRLEELEMLKRTFEEQHNVEKISVQTETGLYNLENDNEELKCQLNLAQKELDKVYERITEQEIQIRSLKISGPVNKELEDQLEKISMKYSILEKTAEQTNLLNDDLNEKYLDAIKKSKNLEAVVKKLYKQIEAKKSERNDKENTSPDNERSSLKFGNDHQTSIPIVNKASPAFNHSILKRSSTDSEKSSDPSLCAKEPRTNNKLKLGPAARVPAIESRKIRKIDSSRDGRQECNQQ